MNIYRNSLITAASSLLISLPLTAFAAIADPGFGGITPPAGPPEKTCEVELWHGGLVVLPPLLPSPAPKNPAASDSIRKAADQLEKAGMTAEARRLRMIAEAIETIRERCENLGDPTPPPDDLLPIDNGIIR